MRPSAHGFQCQSLFHIGWFNLPLLDVGAYGADAKGKGEVEVVVLMRGEMRHDRDAAVFDVSLHDGQYPVEMPLSLMYRCMMVSTPSTLSAPFKL